MSYRRRVKPGPKVTAPPEVNESFFAALDSFHASQMEEADDNVEATKVPPMKMAALSELKTPFLTIIRDVAERNCKQMQAIAHANSVSLRPHVKTHKTIQGALLQTGGSRKCITVSTLAEARFYAAAGFTDILYAITLSSNAVAGVVQLHQQSCDLHVLLENTAVVNTLNEQLGLSGSTTPLKVWVDIDSGYHRSGLAPNSEQLLAVAQAVASSKHLQLYGLYTHGGHGYHAHTIKEIQVTSAQERDAVVAAKTRLEEGGLTVMQTAVGSTPTCSHPPVDGLGGITEIHPGNYFLYDTMQADISACTLAQVAVRVTVTIIALYPERSEVVIDAGWTALSAQGADCGYGVIQDYTNLSICRMSQENSVVKVQGSMDGLVEGLRLSILPHHSCAACAMHAKYYVVDTAHATTYTEVWEPCRNW